jgi:uroporphyrinogen decarboxylase
MTKAEKISAVLSGDESGIIPYSFWSHFPGIDLDPHRLAEKTFEFFEQYDIDFIKTAPNGMFSVEDFGCICDYSEIDRGGVAKIVSYPIDTIDDWGKIKPIDCSRGALKRELLSVELLLQKVKDRAPVVITAFSPLTTAVKLSNKKIFQHMKESGSLQVHEALAAIAETTAEFIRKGIELGASGVFFAAQTGSYDIMDESLFREYGVPYDEMALRGCKKGWFNVIHIHGNNIMFDFFKNYPVNVLNWHINETAPTIPEA